MDLRRITTSGTHDSVGVHLHTERPGKCITGNGRVKKAQAVTNT